MKFAKIIVPIIVILTLLGCSTAKSSSTTSTNNQASPTQSQTSTSQIVTASTIPTQLTSILFKWVGVDKDIVSPNDLKTDGKPDGHFHITTPFNQPSAIKSIWIRYSEFGKSFKWGWVYNKNIPIDGYIMAVFDNSGKSIVPMGDNGYRVDGVTDLDLYISELNNENGRDTINFEKNQKYNLEIDYITQNNEVKEFDCSEIIK